MIDRRAALAAAAAIAVCAACGGVKDADASRYAGPFAEQVNLYMPRIERSTGLRFKHAPRVEVRTKAQVRQFLEREFNESRAAREIAGQEAAYKRLGLLPDTMNFRAFLSSLLAEQIVGFYDPKEKMLHVVEGIPDEAVGITLAHELVHALQDQYLNLDSLKNLDSDNDRAMAIAAVTEGQATYEQIAVLAPAGNTGMLWDRARDEIRSSRGTMPVLSSAPLILQESLIFPYLSGADFVRRFKDERPGRQPFDPLPASSEQIMHVNAYLRAADPPTAITFPALTGATLYANGLGEFETRIFLFAHLHDEGSAVRAAGGWDGDRYALVDTPRGEGLVWLSVWDSAVDAGEFYQAVSQTAVRRYAARTAGDSSEARRTMTGAGRSILVTTRELQGRPVVLYVDVPDGASTDLLDLSRVTLRQ